MVGFNPGLAPFSARPPTPPKESSTRLGDGTDPSIFPILANRSLLDTPDESPSSSAEYFKASTEKAQKKVGFSPWTEFHRLPMDGSKDSDSDGSVRRLPPSRECKSLKSILKACKDNTTTLTENELLAFDQTNLAAMLRSAVRHLAGTSRTSRVDAYVTLLGYLSAYDDVPDTTDLLEQVVDITGYIRRDVSAKMGPDGNLDTQIVTQALKVLTVLICIPSTATLLPEDFCSFILDRSTSSIEDPGAPKILVSHYMHLLEKQKFNAKVMTAERVSRLVSALDLVTNRIKGNRIVCHRLMIYQRLLTQAKSTMATRVGSWIDHLISGMLSSIKDVRVRAIGFGVEAGLQLGTLSSVSQSCIEVFNRASPEGTRVIDFLSSRLLEMVGSKEDGIHVPQIWSIVILFFRSRRRQLECWEHVKAWLVIIQRCLNASDPQVKFQANIAWSRLIFVINLDTSTSGSMAKMLRQPMVSQLERKANDKVSKQAKQIARSTYCTLLYYAFRPTASPAQLDQYWDLYIGQILPNSFNTSKSDVHYACDILAALLSSNGQPRMWNENRANMNGPVKPDELPCIDPKWIRSRATNVIGIFEKLLDLADWQTSKAHDTPLLLVWRSFVTALGAASSKEVKVSMDTMNAISGIVNLLKRVLEKGNQSLNAHSNRQQGSDYEGSNDSFDKVGCLTQEAVTKIGAIPFLERRLVLTSLNSFEAAETPSSRSSRNSGSLNSPAIHLLNLLLTDLRNERPTAAYIDTVKSVMHISLHSATSRRTQLGTLRNLARLLSADSTFGRQASLILWKFIAEATCRALRIPPQNDPHNASPHYPGPDYREAVKILELGVQQQSIQTIPLWFELYGCIASSLRKDVGDDGVTLLLTEPLAGVILNSSRVCNEALLIISTALLHDTRWPKSQQSIERAQKLLWGATYNSHKSKPNISFDNLFLMVNDLLSNAYECSTTLPIESIHKFLSSVARMFSSCPPEHQEFMLRQTQRGLSVWIEDSDSRSLPKVDELWEEVIAIVERFPSHGTRLLVSIQPILLSCIKCRHKSILNKFVAMWNRTFGSAEALEYPEDLCKALFQLRSVIDIQLPTFPVAEVDEAMSSPIHLADLHEDDLEEQPLPPTKLPINGARELPARKAPEATLLSPNPRTVINSPLKARREAETTPKARLRHDDSQIQFAAVESSPLAPEPAESQNLTDRQKEVKERQRLEAAMFPEIRSSPKSAPRRAEYTLPKLVYKTDQDPPVNHVADEQNSPIYPPDVLMNHFLGSSPTPASSKKGLKSTRYMDDLPSSPPLLAFHPKVDQAEATPQTAARRTQLPVTDQDDESGDSMNRGTSGMLTNSNASEEHSAISAVDQASRNIGTREEIPEPTARASETNDHIMSDLDVFVDAPSEPVEMAPATAHVDHIHMVPNSFESEKPSRYPSEVDQITAQLVSEMERASSQQSKLEHATKAAPSGERKRKGSFLDSASERKKAKGSPASSIPRCVSVTPQPKEFVAECVLIKARPVEGKTAYSPIRIKRERSQSPSLIGNTPLENEILVHKHRRGRPPGKSRGSQQSQNSSSLHGSPYQKRSPQSDVDDASMASNTQTRARKSARLSGTSTSSPRPSAPSPLEDPIVEPGSVTKRGKRRANKRWFWSKEESHDENQSGTNTDVAAANVDDAELAVRHDHPQQLFGEPESAGQESQDLGSQAGTTKRSEQTLQSEAVDAAMSSEPPTTEGILQGFRRMLSNIKRVALGREEEREMIGVLFESVKEVHEAGRRHSAM